MPRHVLKKAGLFQLFLFQFLLVIGQDEGVNVGNQYWFDFEPHYRISDPFEFYGDLSLRISRGGTMKTYLVRPSFKYHVLSELSLHAGIGFFMNDLEEFNYQEVRPWQGIRLGWPNIGPLNFKHYFRLEQRIFYFPEEQKDFFIRGRYMIKAKLPLNAKALSNNVLYIPFSFEILGIYDEEFYLIYGNQIRCMMGLGYVFNRKWNIEFEYSRWNNKNSVNESFQASDNIFRLRVFRNGWIVGE